MVEHVWGQDKLAGIGIATGSVNRLMVVDLDVKAGHDGITQFFSLMDAWSLQMPSGPVQLTPSGGMHIWLRLPDGVRLPGRTSILPGVDIKGDGGYVAAAPTHLAMTSLDGGRAMVPYRWKDGGCPCALPWAPDWLTDWALHAPGVPAGPGGAQFEGDDDPESLLPALEHYREQGLPNGTRNVTTHRLACSLFLKYKTGPWGVGKVWSTLSEVWNQTDMRGFEHETSTIIKSAQRWAEQQLAIWEEVQIGLSKMYQQDETRTTIRPMPST